MNGTIRHISRVALWLAVATLSRWAFAWRSRREPADLTEERHRQAHTDELTGLGNRRQLSQVLDSSSPSKPTEDAAAA